MASDPTQIAGYGHRWGLYLKNNTSGSEIWTDRVQRVEPTVALRTTPYYELGRVGKVGVTQDPADYRIVIEENLHKTEIDYLLAGLNPAPAGQVSYNLGSLMGKDNTAYLVGRNDSDVVDRELILENLRIAEVQWRFTVRDAIMATWTLQGTRGRWYTTGSLTHTAWGAQDTTSAGGIHGKDARIWLTSGSAAPDRAFRLQSFAIRAAYPITPVSEIGRRELVGQISDSPDVTIDFDVLSADQQPIDKLFTSGTNFFNLSEPAALFNGIVRVYNPDLAEALSIIKSFKMENLRVTQGTPTMAQVRALATMRYSLTVAKETTVDSGGLIIRNGDQA